MTTPPMPPPSLSPATLARVVGGWQVEPGARYRRLADAVVSAIDRGDVPHGTRLPAERQAAGALGLSRGTVVDAYSLLSEAGVVERRRGSGTFVVSRAAAAYRIAELAAGLRARQLTRNTVQRSPAIVDLALSVLPSPEGLPANAFHVDPDHLAALAHGHGYHPAGLPALRERLAALHTAHGLPRRRVRLPGAPPRGAAASRQRCEPGRGPPRSRAARRDTGP